MAPLQRRILEVMSPASLEKKRANMPSSRDSLFPHIWSTPAVPDSRDFSATLGNFPRAPGEPSAASGANAPTQ